ncbi:MAG TPA: nucleotidyltransferase family protein, partial [Bryobacteraceae bacterium]|nr:nucleotidyltransferase family protein [Bryobacteraceae bacterium]
PAAAVILAAGAATRMGKLKQLLPYCEKTLIEHAVEQALAAGFDPVIVVVGAEADSVRAALASRPVLLVENSLWQLGMGSSIAAGVGALPEAHAVAILLADQPLVEARHLREMQALLDSADAPVVAAQYNGTLGVPALFKRELFEALRSLDPATGARGLLRERAAPFPLPEAAMDIDTPEDFAELTGH